METTNKTPKILNENLFKKRKEYILDSSKVNTPQNSDYYNNNKKSST